MTHIILEVYNVPYAHKYTDKELVERHLIPCENTQLILDYINKRHVTLFGDKQNEDILKAINDEDEYIPIEYSWGAYDIYSFSYISSLPSYTSNDLTYEVLDLLDSVAGREMGEGCKVYPSLLNLLNTNPTLVARIQAEESLEYLHEFIRDHCKCESTL